MDSGACAALRGGAGSPPSNPILVSKRWKAIIATLILVVGLCVVVRVLPYLWPIRAADIVQDRQAIDFTDRNGLTLGTLLTRDQEHTASVALNQVSPDFLHAIIAAEDANFYRHGPLEARAFARSIAEAVRARHFVSGASTIDMQLARMLHPVSSTIPGKLRQIWEAWRVGAGMSKDQILAAYVNRLPMGGNIYGVEAASRAYFGIPAAELNLARASLLAAIPNDPSFLNPYEHWKALKLRQTYVLERMVVHGDLTRAQADRAYAEQIFLQPRQQGIIAAPHFLFWLAQTLPPGTARVRTTIDRPLQQFVETQVQQVIGELKSRNVHHAAALVLDNHSGEVLAYVGSPDYFSDVRNGRNDGVQALRQPGSTLKPLLYQYALENDIIRPNTILADVPAHYAIPGGLLYSPSDYSSTFQGPVRVRIALADSLNVPAIRVLERVGVPRFLSRLHELGFKHLTKPPEFYGLGLTLGGGEVSLWELAHAYVTMAREGDAIALVTRLDEPGLKPRHYNVEGGERIGTPVTWQLVTDIISDNYARAKSFGVQSVLALPFATAVKTGTSSDFRDTWTVGYSTDYTVAVWVGNFDGEPMRRVSGVAGAAPLWNRIMLHLHEQREPAPFPPPGDLVRRPICATTGLRPTPACGSAIVYEYFFPADIAEYEHRMELRPLSPEYDEWLAAQHQAVGAAQGFRILSPHDGDYYLVFPASLDPAARQRLEFQAVSIPGQAVEWKLNGRRLASTSPDSVFWSLRAGRWTLEAKSGHYNDKVTFEVAPARPHLGARGFSFATAPQGKGTK